MNRLTLHRTVLTVAALGVCAAASAQTLERFASLPADTFAPGPTSGQLILPPFPNGRVPPFVDKQPVQGFSSVLRTSKGDFLAMPDNGFGTKESSPDYILRVYRISPDFKTRRGGTATIDIESFITLRDPHHKINFPILAEREVYLGPRFRSIRESGETAG